MREEYSRDIKNFNAFVKARGEEAKAISDIGIAASYRKLIVFCLILAVVMGFVGFMLGDLNAGMNIYNKCEKQGTTKIEGMTITCSIPVKK